MMVGKTEIKERTEAFIKAYNGLNAEQKKAVDTIEGPVMVIAGPGTGKTTILTLRIANILQKTDVGPSGILAITFTEAGVKAMRMKLRKIIGARADEVRIHTFHGFASSVLSEFDDHFPHLADSEQITDIEAEDMIRSILKKPEYKALRPLGEPDYYVGKIIGAISDAKREAWTADSIRTHAKEEIERIKNDQASISTRGASKGQLKAEALKRIEKCERTLVFADVYQAYEAQKQKEKKLDFDDLIIQVLVGLKNDELLLRMLQEKFLYVLVDEHQDTNDAQNLLVHMIADFFESPNLFVVGDEKQAVYRFQGASVENFLKFQSVWKNMEVISLKSNYRSHQHILDAGFSLIENNYGEGEHITLRVKLNAAGNGTAQPIEIISAGNTEAAEKRLATDIKTILETKPESTVAVIVRTNRDVERTLQALEFYGISASSEKGADIFTHAAGVLFFDLIRYLGDQSRTDALAKTIAGGLWNISFEDSVKLMNDIRGEKLGDIPQYIPALAELRDAALTMNPVSYLIYAADVSGFTKLISLNPLSVEVWRGIVAFAEELARKNTSHTPVSLIETMLAYVAASQSRVIKIGVGASDAPVQVMTIHGSKGLEFDYVFMPYCTEESWPMKSRNSYFILPREKEDGDEIRDARRLFYVGITRARKHVTIMSECEQSDGKQLTPLRFLEELIPDVISRVNIPAIHEQATHAQANTKRSRMETMLAEYTKRVLDERGLSVTALNHFLTCPSLFLYKSILRLPEAPHPSSEKGNAMHAALSAVWKLEARTEATIAAILEKEIRQYFEKKSSLPKFEKEMVEKELLEDLPEVVASLKDHFAQTGDIMTESWFERDLNGVSLHGRLDTVIATDNEVLVFDYKTRASMSENEIKGNTKNSNGDYFRQLVYYKILLETNPKFKGKHIIPALVFVRPDAKGRCQMVTFDITEVDKEKVLAEITQLVEAVKSGSMIKNICADSSCEWCKRKQLRLV
jgi:DNA helicase-2/ATP-dependent DNA helicase PcrA